MREVTVIQRRPWIRWVVVFLVTVATSCLLWAVRVSGGATWYWPASALIVMAALGAMLATRWQQASVRDALTGLYNRRHLSTRLDWEVKRNLRRRESLSLIIIDVDDFKRFNDQHGHAVGDEVLVAIANLLTETLRQSDWIARWGGEEFAVILPDTPLSRAITVAERLRTRVHSLRQRDIGSLRVTISAGVASCPDHAVSAKDLMDLADEAMYEAKQQKDRVLVAPLAHEPRPPRQEPKTTKRVANSG